LSKVSELPDFSKNTKLEFLSIQNLKCLADLSNIRTATSLEALNLTHAMGQDPNHIKECLLGSSVKHINVAFGSVRKNNDFEKWALENGFKVCIPNIYYEEAASRTHA